MAIHKEFYAPPGASINFIGSMCLDHYGDIFDSTTNEYRAHLVNDVLTLDEIDFPIRSMLRKEKAIKQSYDIMAPNMKAYFFWLRDNKTVPLEVNEYSNHLDNIDKWAITPGVYCYEGIWGHFGDKDLDKRTSEYFNMLGLKYYEIHDELDVNTYILRHTINHNKELRDKVSYSLEFEIDILISIYTRSLFNIKHKINSSIVSVADPHHYNGATAQVLDFSMSAEYDIDTSKVSYRKVFFENDVDEILKLYEFFDNTSYFYSNRERIMKEFRDYHTANMLLVKEHQPILYEQVNGKI